MQDKAQKKSSAPVVAPPSTPDNVEATVFVRGLPLDTLQYELQDRMSRYGKLKACRFEFHASSSVALSVSASFAKRNQATRVSYTLD